MAATVVLKKEMRGGIRKALAGLSEAAIDAQSTKAVNALLSMPEYRSAKSVSIYLAMPKGEISTTRILHDALEQQKRVFIPYTYKPAEPKEGQPRSIMDMLELRSVAEYEELKRDGWGIPTLTAAQAASRANSFGGTGLTDGAAEASPGPESGLDLIVMPGMAFDTGFGRLGHGKGFYDHFLQRCHQWGRLPFRVGLSLTEQFLPQGQSVPMDATDYRLDALILGSGEIRRAGTESSVAHAAPA